MNCNTGLYMRAGKHKHKIDAREGDIVFNTRPFLLYHANCP